MTANLQLSRLADLAKDALARAANHIEPLLPADATLVHWSLYAWLLCLLCLCPAVWRIMTLRPRSLDPIWGLVFLLAMNRLSFLAHISPEVSHATALILALAMAALSTWYQRTDRRLET